MVDSNLQKIIEALMFVSEKPLTYKQILEVCTGAELSEVKAAMNQLKEHYNNLERGIHIREVAGGHQFFSNPDCAEYLKKLYKTRRVFRLSAPALETLAIIAYKQPVTRAEIEFIRGVNVDGVVKTLEDRDLIKIKGRKEVPGKPLLYGTTDAFLHYFGLKSLQGLPTLEEFKAKNMEYTQEEQQVNEQENPSEEPVGDDKVEQSAQQPADAQENTPDKVEQSTQQPANTQENTPEDTGVETLEADKVEDVLENGEEGDGNSANKEAAKNN